MLRLLKFTLDLFDVAPVYEPIQKSPTKRTKPAATPSDKLQPESATVYSRHAQASQQTRLVGRVIDYELLRSRRRTMTFSVSQAGLSVRAPFGMPQHTIEAAVQEKARWIVRKIDGMQKQDARMAALKMDWLSGANLAYLGSTLQVRLDVGAKRDEASLNSAGVHELTLALPATTGEKKIRDTTKKWIALQATQHYTARMNHYAPMLGVKWQSLALTNANTRWGSAKADGSIRLHWRLMQFSPDVIDYVIAHELSHLRELNHSPRFWAIVASVLPDYEARQKELKAQVLPPWE